jgi:hypothetical protein
MSSIKTERTCSKSEATRRSTAIALAILRLRDDAHKFHERKLVEVAVFIRQDTGLMEPTDKVLVILPVKISADGVIDGRQLSKTDYVSSPPDQPGHAARQPQALSVLLTATGVCFVCTTPPAGSVVTAKAEITTEGSTRNGTSDG